MLMIEDTEDQRAQRIGEIFLRDFHSTEKTSGSFHSVTAQQTRYAESLRCGMYYVRDLISPCMFFDRRTLASWVICIAEYHWKDVDERMVLVRVIEDAPRDLVIFVPSFLLLFKFPDAKSDTGFYRMPFVAATLPPTVVGRAREDHTEEILFSYDTLQENPLIAGILKFLHTTALSDFFLFKGPWYA